MSPVLIVATGSANLASVIAAFERAGVSVRLTESAAEAAAAPFLVLPGVGAFAAAMEKLVPAGLVPVLKERIAAGRPTFTVCLGLQLLADASEESPGVAGLGEMPATVKKFPLNAGVTVPQLGWNGVYPDAGCRLLRPGYAYYANSFRVPLHEPGAAEKLRAAGWSLAVTHHAGEFLAAAEKAEGKVLACQFHPELSGPWGASLIRRWLVNAGAIAASAADESPAVELPAKAQVCRRVIPCLDVKDGRVVKGVKFQGLRDAGDPVELARRYEQEGADELVFLDVSATIEGRKSAAETVAKVRKVISIPLTVGGGVRSVEDAKRLLDAGADKVGVNSAAVFKPELLTELAERFGRQCVVLAIDAGKSESGAGWQVIVRSGTDRQEIDAVKWAARGEQLGAGEILLTSWDRDGTRSGYDLAVTQAVAEAVSCPVIASGGVANATHLAEGIRAKADAVLAASIFHDGNYTVRQVKDALLAEGFPIRR